MTTKCPGQDSRNLKICIHICPQCGKEVEMFSDEMKTKCPQCKTIIEKENVPSCIQWCKEAKRCLGTERWEQMMEIMDKDLKE